MGTGKRKRNRREEMNRNRNGKEEKEHRRGERRAADCVACSPGKPLIACSLSTSFRTLGSPCTHGAHSTWNSTALAAVHAW